MASSSRNYLFTRFDGRGPTTQDDGTVAQGAAGAKNLTVIDGVPWHAFGLGTQTVFTPIEATTGLDFKQTDTNGQGNAWTPWDNALGNPLLYTIGTTPAFFVRLKVTATDWSGAQLMVGFHGGAAGTIQAHQSDVADYTDKALIGNWAGGALSVQTNTALNNAGDVTTDTTIDVADGETLDLKVLVSAAGVVTYTASIDGTAQTLTTVAYTFDDTDNVLPMIYHINHTDTVTLLQFEEFECGLQ